MDSKPSPAPKIRRVWRHNVTVEFYLISRLIHRYPYVSMDTEFPGTIFKPDPSRPTASLPRNPTEHYRLLKCNVDALNIIQVGLTLSDSDGNLPSVMGFPCIWEFNFCDFDPRCQPHAPDSIALLERQGINFNHNRFFGIHSRHFALEMVRSGILFNSAVTWVTFHSGYDFGFLIKSLSGRPLPRDLGDFMKLIRSTFGSNVYDMKHVMRFCDNLYGGLERVATELNVDREVGMAHQAGSDSLLTCRAFQKMRDVYFEKDEPERFAGVIYGLECH